MAQMTVKINGYAYTVGCEDGQESHLNAMALEVQSRIDSIKALGGQSGEARLLVLAALLMADELHDVKSSLSEARSAATDEARAAATRAPEAEKQTRRRLARLADKAEEIAAGLERA